MWRPIDGLAEWLRHTFGVQAQLRMGVLMVLGSIPLLVYGFWTHEPFLVYQMSAFALLFAGIGVVVTAETLQEVAEDVDDVAGTTRATGEYCSACGQRLRPEPNLHLREALQGRE